MARDLGEDDSDDMDLSSESDLDTNSDDEVIIGERLEIRRTSHEYRGYDPLLVTERLDIEATLATVESMVTIGHITMTFIVILLGYTRLMLGANGMMAKIQPLLQTVSWIVCYGKLRLLDVDDALMFIRQPHRFRPERNRTIRSLSRDVARNKTGHNRRQLRKLFRHWRVAQGFEEANHSFTAEEAFLIFMTHTRKGTCHVDLTDTFGGDPRRYTYMVRAMVTHLYKTFYHKVSGNSMEQWCSHEQVEEFRHAMWEEIVHGEVRDDVQPDGTILEVDVEEILPFDEFRPFCFIDDTVDPTGRPGDEPMRTTRQGENLVDPQRSFFRYVKTQLILLVSSRSLFAQAFCSQHVLPWPRPQISSCYASKWNDWFGFHRFSSTQ